MKTATILVLLVFIAVLIIMVNLMMPWLFPTPAPDAFAQALGVPV